MHKITEVRIPTDIGLEVKINELVRAVNQMRGRPDRLEEAMGHLGSAISQSSPKLDDKIIMDHVRDAHILLRSFLQEWRSP